MKGPVCDRSSGVSLTPALNGAGEGVLIDRYEVLPLRVPNIFSSASDRKKFNSI